MQSQVDREFEKFMLAAPDRILIATDLGDLDYLVPQAISQAKVCGAKLRFVHVLSSSNSISSEDSAGATPSYLRNDPAKMIRDARLALLGVERQIEREGIACDTRVCHGGVTEVIIREIHQTEATRLIIGTRGLGKLGRLVMGSVANRLMTSVNIPVLGVGPQARKGARQMHPRQILYPVSLMKTEDESIRLPLNIAQSCRAELTLMHVIAPDLLEGNKAGPVLDWATARLKSLVPAGDLMPAVHTRVTCGEVAEEVLKAAEQSNADMILLGSSGYSRWSFNDSLAYRVLSGASCPVLAYRRELSRSRTDTLETIHCGTTSPLPESYEAGQRASIRMAQAS